MQMDFVHHLDSLTAVYKNMSQCTLKPLAEEQEDAREKPLSQTRSFRCCERLISDQAGFIQGMGSAQFGHLGVSKDSLKQDLAHLETGTGLGGSTLCTTGCVTKVLSHWLDYKGRVQRCNPFP